MTCGGHNTTLRLLKSETTLEIRVFADATFAEVFLQRGRAAVTAVTELDAASTMALGATAPTAATLSVWPIKSIWVDEATVRATPRSYAGWSDE